MHGAGAPADDAVAGVAEGDLDGAPLADERPLDGEVDPGPGHDDGALPRGPLQRRLDLVERERVGREAEGGTGGPARADDAGVGGEAVALADLVVGESGHGRVGEGRPQGRPLPSRSEGRAFLGYRATVNRRAWATEPSVATARRT